MIAELLRQRSAAWSGIAELYAHRIMPRLAQKDHARFADRISPEHPVEGMREALGVMALIADVLCREEPLWGVSGDRLLDDWLALTGRHIHAIRGSSDPIAAALDELLVQWNRLVEDRYSGRTYRPAFTEQRFVCRPLFRLDPSRQTEGAGPHTLDIDHAERDGRGVAPVVGFVGTYAELYRDVVEASRNAAAFHREVDSAETLGAKIGNVDGWSSQVHRKPRNARRIYRWISTREEEA